MIAHPIESRILTSFHATEYPLAKKSNYLFDLSYLTVLKLQGDKALAFLQGQLTSDLLKVSDSRMMPSAQCNLKGRVLALLDIIQWQGLQLVLPKDLVEKTQYALEKTAQLSRVSFREESSLKLFGFFLQNHDDVFPVEEIFSEEQYTQVSSQGYCFYHLGEGFYIFITLEGLAPALCQPFIDKDQFLGSNTWHALRLMHNQFDIYPESRGLFLPHKLGLQNTDYISFDKGCYKGQEIIARMHYRATLKHELKVFTVNTSETLFIGQKLLSNTLEIGEVVDYAYLSDTTVVIAVSILKERPPEVFFELHNSPIHLE
ncbi:MAG: folate-binding protein YgfZ [Legionella sp.]|nr:folate-binding protein YgfZ [Legionella sp.]